MKDKTPTSAQILKAAKVLSEQFENPESYYIELMIESIAIAKKTELLKACGVIK